MGNKFKPRQMKNPRNHEVVSMLLGCKGGPMKNKADKRVNRKSWKKDLTDEEIASEARFRADMQRQKIAEEFWNDPCWRED